MLTKIDENGKFLWGKEFSGIGNNVINSISKTEDEDYILVSDTVLIKVDNWGNILWKKAFEKLADGWINSVQQTKDGGYILAGNKVKDGAEDAWLIKIDSAGNEQWNKTFGGTFQDSTYFVQQTPDGGFILAGLRSYRNYGYEAWLIKTDGSGNLQWIKPFRGSGISSAYSVLMTQDGGFVVSGYTSPYWPTNSDALLIKVGGETNGTGNSNISCNEDDWME